MPILSISPPTPDLSKDDDEDAVSPTPAGPTSTLQLDPEFDSQPEDDEADLSTVAEGEEETIEPPKSQSLSMPQGLRKLLNLGPSTLTAPLSPAIRSSTRSSPASSLQAPPQLPAQPQIAAPIPFKAASSLVPQLRNIGGWETEASSVTSTFASPPTSALARSNQPAMSQRASTMKSLSELSKASAVASPMRTTRSRSARQESVPLEFSQMETRNGKGRNGGGSLFAEASQIPESQSQPQQRNQWAALESDSESGSDSEANINANGNKKAKKGVVWK